jgi:hypothetical protein
MDVYKNVNQAKTADVDTMLCEWTRKHWSETFPLDRSSVTGQATVMDEQFGLRPDIHKI